MADMPFIATTVTLENRVIRQREERQVVTITTTETVDGYPRKLAFTVGLRMARSIHASLGRALAKADEQRKDT